MKDLNAIITKNFEDNIAYFQDEHPLLFEKLSALDSAIENGHYQEKYELVYENDGFDVLEKSSNSSLYAKESLAHSVIATHSINHKIDIDTFEGFVRHSNSSVKLKDIKDAKPFSNYLSAVLPLISYIENNTPEDKELNSIDKFIFFGTGLGLHIEEIHKKIASKIYFIIEDDLELFKLSLLTLNYKNIANTSTLIFSVFEGKEEFMNSCAVFLDLHYEYNHYLNFFHLLSHNEDKLDEFQLSLSSQPHITFLFNNLMLQYTQPFKYIFDDYKFLNKSINFMNSDFKELPFLILASGPSLEENIEWLKANEEKFVTVAVSSSLAYLESQNIVPNIIIHIDPFEWGILSFEKLKSLKFIKDSLCLFSSNTPPNIISLIDKKNLYLFEIGTDYKDFSFKPSSPCVGSLAYQLLLIMNIKNIFLLGLDLAVDDKTGKTHSGTHQSLQELKGKDKIDNESTYSFTKSLLNVAGNKVQTVQTTPSFYSSIYVIEEFTSKLKKKSQNVYNISSGAKFKSAIPIDALTFQLSYETISPQHLVSLKKYFEKNSQNKLTEKELRNFKDKLVHAKELQKFLENYKERPFGKVDEYLEDIFLHLTPKSDLNKYELSRILNTYLQYISSYIYDFFNSNKVSDSTVHLERISSLLQKHLIKIIQYYQNRLEDKLNGRN